MFTEYLRRVKVGQKQRGNKHTQHYGGISAVCEKCEPRL